MSFIVLIDYPKSQAYVVDALRRAFEEVMPFAKIITSHSGEKVNLQWSDYDELKWDLPTQFSCYVIRKALIRKNHLAHTSTLYCAKNPTSILNSSIPKSYNFEISWADELDELLQDDLYGLSVGFTSNESLPVSERKYWLVKPAFADRGNGIRLFSSAEELEEIFQEFDPSTTDEDSEGESQSSTIVNSSQMKEFVIQEYIHKPLLLDPSTTDNIPTKFHLRIYVLSIGSIQVYVSNPYLALFAATRYEFPPSRNEDGVVDLSSHLTNTCLQSLNPSTGENVVNVSTLSALVGKTILCGSREGQKLTEGDVSGIEKKVEEVTGEIFRAAVNSGSSFQPIPNAFEIFGVDFLVDSDLNVSLLEVNACPDFGQTGNDLKGIIEDLFKNTIRLAILPTLSPLQNEQIEIELAGMSLGEGGMTKVLNLEILKRP